MNICSIGWIKKVYAFHHANEESIEMYIKKTNQLFAQLMPEASPIYRNRLAFILRPQRGRINHNAAFQDATPLESKNPFIRAFL